MALNDFFYFTASFAVFINSISGLDTEPKCSKFDFEEKVLEKMVRMEHSTELMRDQLAQAKNEIEIIKGDLAKSKQETKESLKEGMLSYVEKKYFIGTFHFV